MNNTVLKLLQSILIFLIMILLFSCQRIISVDLNSSSPKIVIEGNISDQLGPCTVKISQTVNFDQTNNFPPVTGAVVIISDNLRNVDTLSETSPGIYTTSSLHGIPGRTYTLNVSVNRNDYSAVSTMPEPVNINALTIGSAPSGKKKAVYVNFNDPAGIKNYYRFVEIINGVQQNYIFLTSDLSQDGASITSILFTEDDNYVLTQGDSVEVLLLSIDDGTYEYFRSLNQITRNGKLGIRTATPTNPVSNVSNGALGYFSAYSIRSGNIVVP